MAMLAEPRQRKRYNLVPKGKALFEDGDRFGTKMLEKMGWSKGKGLGRHENGQQEFVRVRYKNDANGLGFEDRDDQWTEHEKHFNGLLENLNGGDSTGNSASDGGDIGGPSVGLGFQSKSASKKLKDKISGQSLEEKSKNSKARVHYKKFTKGKDMSQYSEKDLANIFGKKATPDDVNIYAQFQAFGVVASEEKEEAKEECVKKIPTEIGTHIVNTGVSVSDYFKLKMAALKEKKGEAVVNGEEAVGNDLEDEAPLKKKKSKKRSADVEDEETVPVSKENVEVPRKKKKSKKVLECSEGNEAIVLSGVEEVEFQEEKKESLSRFLIQEEVSSKKKKSKKQIVSTEENGMPSQVEGVEAEPRVENTELNDSVQKEASSKKKKDKKGILSSENNPIVMPSEIDETELPLEKKSKASVDAELNVALSPEDDSSKKKKAKKTTASNEVNGTLSLAEYVQPADGELSLKRCKRSSGEAELNDSVKQDIPKKKKKSKKVLVIVIESDVEDDLKKSGLQEADTSTINSSFKKKKSKQPSVENVTEEVNKNESRLLETITTEIPIKKKKNKKRPTEEFESTDAVLEECLPTTAIPIMKKKTKVDASEDPIEDSSSTQESASEKLSIKKSAIEDETTSELATLTASTEEKLKKKKKNKKSKQSPSEPTPLIEKFRNVELHQFQASNLSEICGYGLSENLQLDIKSIKSDQERILRLWSGTLDKYQYATPRHKIYNSYITKAKQARRTNNKVPKIKVKCLKRKNVFECL